MFSSNRISQKETSAELKCSNFWMQRNKKCRIKLHLGIMFCITLVLNPEWTVKIKLMIQKSWRSRRHFIYVAAGFSALENFPSQSASFTHHWCIHYYITNKWNDLNTRFSKGSLRSFFDGGISILSLHLFRQFYKIGCAFSQNPVSIPQIFKRREVSAVAVQKEIFQYNEKK